MLTQFDNERFYPLFPSHCNSLKLRSNFIIHRRMAGDGITLKYLISLDIRASRHSGPVRREPDGPRAAEFDAGKAGSGGDGGVNHPGLHRNASGRVEFPPSAVPRFCRRNIPEGSDEAGLDHAGGEIPLLAPGCDLSQRRGRGIGLDGQHLDQRPPDLDDGQPTMESFRSTDCIHMSIMPSPHFRAANMGSIVQRRE